MNKTGLTEVRGVVKGTRRLIQFTAGGSVPRRSGDFEEGTKGRYLYYLRVLSRGEVQ